MNSNNNKIYYNRLFLFQSNYRQQEIIDVLEKKLDVSMIFIFLQEIIDYRPPVETRQCDML